MGSFNLLANHVITNQQPIIKCITKLVAVLVALFGFQASDFSINLTHSNSFSA